MRRISSLVFMLIALCSCSHIQKAFMAASGDPFGAGAEQLARGKGVYTLHCAECHGQAGKGDGPRAESFQAKMPDFSDGSFDKSPGLTAANINYGKRDEMPAFKDRLSEQEIWAVAHYVLSLKQL